MCKLLVEKRNFIKFGFAKKNFQERGDSPFICKCTNFQVQKFTPFSYEIDADLAKANFPTFYSKHQLSILVQLSEKIFNGSLPKMQVNQINCDWKLKIELWHYGVLKVRNTLRFLFSIIWIGGHSQYTLIK